MLPKVPKSIFKSDFGINSYASVPLTFNENQAPKHQSDLSAFENDMFKECHAPL